jgi:hypothetical protein
MDFATLRNKLKKSKKRVGGEIGPGFSSEEELASQFSTVSSRKNPKKSVNDSAKKSSDKDQNINKPQIHKQAKARVKEGSVRQVESETQRLGNNSINGKEDLGESLFSWIQSG